MRELHSIRFLTVAALAAIAACNNTPAAAPPANDSTQVTVLARPSDTAAADWDAAAPPPPTAGAPTPESAPGASTATPADLESKDPGTYVVDGYVVRSQQCPPCAPGTHCKPCELAIYISAQKPGAGDPPDTIDVQISDSTTYAAGAHYRFVITVTQSANQSTRRLFSATPE